MYDLIIKNANIVDGTGSPAFSADIAIKDGKIALVGYAGENAAQVIDAKGLTATEFVPPAILPCAKRMWRLFLPIQEP